MVKMYIKRARVRVAGMPESSRFRGF